MQVRGGQPVDSIYDPQPADKRRTAGRAKDHSNQKRLSRNKIPSDLQGFAYDLALVSIVTAPRQTNGRLGYDADTLREVSHEKPK